MRALLFCLLVVLFPAEAHAVDVRLEMRPGITASAEYHAGQRAKPAVLLLHGFLQTRDFPTVAALARGLRDAGYSVLVPTLSLGIPDRRQSLACEAVHTHSLDDDVAEIGRWVSWLKSQNHRSIVLAGHSFGSLQLLAYLAERPDPAVKAYIGASLIEAQIRTPRRAQLIARLESEVRTKPDALFDGQLTYCNRYPSTPRALLSYVRWDQAHTLAALTHAPVKTGLIMGEADYMLGSNWLRALKHLRTPLAIVQGANHFMDGEHELDLLDHTLYFLDTFKLNGT
jgi:pimeloyl-ACP methyl ester carboxylesterase